MTENLIRLVPMRHEDIALRILIETDARMMSELGGINTKEQVEASHSRAMKNAEDGLCWYFKIVATLQESEQDVGYIGIWESSWKDEKINETGWMIIPEFQGMGFASQAGRSLIAKSRSEGKYPSISAFPGRNNIASNKICEKLGFSMIEECEVDYQQRILLCNHWLIRL